MRIDVKNKHGMIIGYYESSGSIRNAYHMQKGYAGRYVESSNLTFDSHGYIFAQGNALDAVIRSMDV